MEAIVKEKIRVAIEKLKKGLAVPTSLQPNRSIQNSIVEKDLARLVADCVEWLDGKNEHLDWVGCTYEMSSIMFCMGFPRESWTYFVEIVAEAMERSKASDSLPLSILCGRKLLFKASDWDDDDLADRSYQFRILFDLLFKPLKRDSFCEEGGYYSGLFVNSAKYIQESRLEAASQSLLKASQYWRLEDSNWDEYERGAYPQYDLYLCALVFIYGERGGAFSGWPKEDIQFLYPGVEPFVQQ